MVGAALSPFLGGVLAAGPVSPVPERSSPSPVSGGFPVSGGLAVPAAFVAGEVEAGVPVSGGGGGGRLPVSSSLSFFPFLPFFPLALVEAPFFFLEEPRSRPSNCAQALVVVSPPYASASDRANNLIGRVMLKAP